MAVELEKAPPSLFAFFFNDTPPTEIYTLSLHDALPIFHWPPPRARVPPRPRRCGPRRGPPPGHRPRHELRVRGDARIPCAGDPLDGRAGGPEGPRVRGLRGDPRPPAHEPEPPP